MPEPQSQNLAGLYRQVVVRVPAADVPRLEAAARAHGSIQAAVIAGLRALPTTAAALPPAAVAPPAVALASAPTPASVPTPASAPRPAVSRRRARSRRPPAVAAVVGEGDRWVALDGLAGQLDVSPASLRRRAKRDDALRGRGGGAQVNVDRLVVERHLAAGLVGVTSRTLRKWILSGKLSNLADAQQVRLGEIYPD